MTSLLDIREELRDATGRKDRDSMFDRKINQAYLQAVFLARIPEFMAVRVIPTVASQANYALNTDEFAPMSFRNTTKKTHPAPITFLQYDALDDTITGLPLKWCAYANEVLFHPTPNAIFSMRMRVLMRPTELTEASPTLATKLEYDELITMLALQKVAVVLQLGDTMQLAASAINGILSTLKAREMVVQEHEFDQGWAWSGDD